MKLKIPTSKQLSKVLSSIKPRYRPVFEDMFAGVDFGLACKKHGIPRMTVQLHSWIATATALGYAVPPKRLQHLVILRRIASGESVSAFKPSSVRSAKLCLMEDRIAAQIE